jgi:hypothetical protein
MPLNLQTMKSLHPFIAPLIVLLGANAVSAQDIEFATPDRNGDYFSNYAPIQGKQPANSKNMPGSLWQVVSPGLNCRRGTGTNFAIVRSFGKGTILQADVGRGGADEVLYNGKDKQGKPWMLVRSEAGESYSCNVRANIKYIKPYKGK